MHGRISGGGGGGSGFCHRNCNRDSSAGCREAMRQCGEGEREGRGQAAVPGEQCSLCKGVSPGD